MFIDTSALVSILLLENDAQRFAAAIKSAENKYTSGLVRLEASMVLAQKMSPNVQKNLKTLNFFLNTAQVQTLEITDQISDLAIDAFDRFGKGRGHGAALNLADCMTYAVAKYHRLPILFKGNDFGKTDALVVVLPKN